MAILPGLAGHSCIYFDTIDDIKARYREFHQQERFYGGLPWGSQFYSVSEQVENILEDHIETCQIVQYERCSNVTRTHPEHSSNIVTT